MKQKKCSHCSGSGEEPDHVKTGREMRHRREFAGITMAKIAREMNIDRSHVFRLEKGLSPWSEFRKREYMKALHVKP